MALILQLETSTTSCSVSLAANGTTLALKELNERNIHASHITVFIEDVLRQAGMTIKDIDAVAVSMGPGSYTGLRIGVSTAKGLCYALDKPLIAVGTLKAMAAGMQSQVTDQDLLLCPMIDARRMEVFTAIFDKRLNEISAVEARIIDNNSFADLLADKRILFFGDGAEKCASAFSQQRNAEIMTDFHNSAEHLNAIALERYQAGQFEDTAYFEPYYLKDFIATTPRKLS